MKAIQVHKYINNAADFASMTEEQGNEYITLDENVEKPILPTKTKNKKKNPMLIQVYACSVAPGDQMVTIQGKLVIMQQSKFPFVPGMDVCGKVIDNNNSTLYKNGDVVVASNEGSLTGGLAEYMVVNEDECNPKPDKVDIVQAASCSSAATARNAVMDHVTKGDRVLVLGGSGGVGSAAIQIAKNQAMASFVATTSTQVEMCKQLGADRIINYREEDWWTIPEFQQNKFDVIIDTVGGGNYDGRADKVCKTGKQGGTFVAVTGDEKFPDLSTMWKFLGFIGRTITNSIRTKFVTKRLPKYVLLLPYDENNARKDALEWMQQGSLVVKLDKDCPLPFTAKGVRDAFVKVASGHAHGKVAIEVSSAKE